MYPNQYITKLISSAVNNEWADSRYYNMLSSAVTDIEDKKILMDISMDEEKHYKMLTELFTELNGSYPEVTKTEPELNSNILNCISDVIIDETEAVENYRVLLFALENPKYKNIITEIIFDEQNHAAKLNYLYSKNK